MRSKLLFIGCASLLAALVAAGCSDGEEKSGGTGGLGGVGGDASTCYSASFTAPTDGQSLDVADDLDGDCSNGLDVDVSVATNAPAGTQATLLVGGQAAGTATVNGAVVEFKSVKLPSKATSELTVRFGSQTECDTTISAKSTCDLPSCVISKPALSATHPKLNGVPVGEGGDRVSTPGQDYQAAFEVSTDIADGQPVTLNVDGKASAAVSIAQSGVAVFPGVTLIPDGDHKVTASCNAGNGKTGVSQEATLGVDTAPPVVSGTVPADGEFFGPTEDTNSGKPGVQFKVCGQTSSADALNLPASLGAGAQNWCVGIGTATPTCSAATTGGAHESKDGGCVELDCPGGAPFDLTVALKDEAGNPTTKTIVGVRCASSLPSVQIIEPVDGTGADIAKHILAASAPQARKDQDSNAPGAQYTVVACTDSANGKGQLSAGLAGGSVPVGAPVNAAPAAPADNCPSGLAHVLKFTNVTVPESAQSASGALATATELSVEVSDVSTAKGTSPKVQVWVDSTAPTITENFPSPLCGKLFQGATAIQSAVQLASQAVPVNMTVTNSAGTQNYTAGTVPGIVGMGQVTFQPGQNDVTATATEPSGNAGALKTPCTVTVGNPPVVTWTAPTAATALNASTDGDSSTPGWQGTLTVQTDVGGSGGTVTFEQEIGAAKKTLGTVPINGSGVATLSSATVDEGASVKLTATTSNISAKGVGAAALTKVVDVVVPAAPTGLSATVKVRRATTFALTWTAPADGTQAVAGYDVRVSRSPITAGNFTSAESVAFLGTPKAAGGMEALDVTNRVIETDYYFAVVATDASGNRSPLLAAGPNSAKFNSVILSGATGETFGYSLDGSTSINGDALADLLVGTRAGNAVYAYFGKASGFGPSPDIAFSGTAGTQFGRSVAVVGDIDADGLSDIAIAAASESSRGKVYIFKGRATWPATLNTLAADYVVEVDAAADSGFTNSFFGTSIAPLGDFNGDGAADFAVGAPVYAGGNGYIAIILGVTTGNPFPSVVSLPTALGTRALQIKGAAAVTQLGASTTALAAFYAGGVPALVAGAPVSGTIYAFKGGTGLPTTIPLGDNYVGNSALRTGQIVTALGTLGGVPALGASSPGLTSNGPGSAHLFFGTTGVFAGNSSTFTNSQATANGDMFGRAIIGSGFSGSTVGVSLINGPQADFAISSVKVGGALPAKLYIIDGAKASPSADVAAAGVADVVYTLPAGWLGAGERSGPVRDADGDGFAELAIAEQPGSGTYDGRVLVLW